VLIPGLGAGVLARGALRKPPPANQVKYSVTLSELLISLSKKKLNIQSALKKIIVMILSQYQRTSRTPT
jgi:hypothetical protein